MFFSINSRASKDNSRSKKATSRDWMTANCKGSMVKVEGLCVGWGWCLRSRNWKWDYCYESVQDVLSIVSVSETCLSIWSIFDPDQPYSTNPGRQQEEDLHQETSLYVRLRTIGHRLPTHTSAAGDYCVTSYNRATTGMFVSYNVGD